MPRMGPHCRSWGQPDRGVAGSSGRIGVPQSARVPATASYGVVIFSQISLFFVAATAREMLCYSWVPRDYSSRSTAAGSTARLSLSPAVRIAVEVDHFAAQLPPDPAHYKPMEQNRFDDLPLGKGWLFEPKSTASAALLFATVMMSAFRTHRNGQDISEALVPTNLNKAEGSGGILRHEVLAIHSPRMGIGVG